LGIVIANTSWIVLDLPQIYTRPDFDALKAALNLLELKPMSWSKDKKEEHETVQDDPQAIASYLTKVVSNGLKWMTDEEREEIWELASRRLSERSGRTGMWHFLAVFDTAHRLVCYEERGGMAQVEELFCLYIHDIVASQPVKCQAVDYRGSGVCGFPFALLYSLPFSLSTTQTCKPYTTKKQSTCKRNFDHHESLQPSPQNDCLAALS
jgi:hypothetical protein